MKKFFTLVAFLLSAISMMAKEYSCPLEVKLSKVGLEYKADNINVTVDEANGIYTFQLKNFELQDLGSVGTITVTNIKGEACGTTTALATQQDIIIKAGDDASKEWMGPTLGSVPINMKAEIKGEELNAVLSINMGSVLGIINVNLGEKSKQIGQIPNSNFEEFHDAKSGNKTAKEPTAWHSFMSAKAKNDIIAAFLKDCIEVSDEVRDGATGTCVKLFSSNAQITSANGTISTGRLAAGSQNATDKANNSFLDLSSTDKDNNGDPFYTVLNSKPDSLKAWVKYEVGNRQNYPGVGIFHSGVYDNTPYIYATASAIITDGTYYQDPEEDNTTYKNVVAKAVNDKIEDTNGEWKELAIAFKYVADDESKDVTPRGILVTFSTCAQPGGGSRDDDERDYLWIDDVSLVYNAGLKALSYKGNDITVKGGTTDYTVTGTGDEVSLDDIKVISDGRGAFISKSLKQLKKGVKVTITITSNDLKTANSYSLTINGAQISTGINAPQTITTPNGVQAIYNLAGQQVSSMTSGQVYIVKTTDGKTKKVIKK